MKNLRLYSAFFVLLSALSLTSCTTDIEPIDPAVLNPVITDCSKPTAFHVSDFVNGNTINLNWVPGGVESSWEVEYGVVGFVQGTGTTIASNDNNLTVDGLDSTVAYEFYIRGFCSEDAQSEWVGPVGINSVSIDCVPPTALSAARSASDATQAVVTWTAGGTETAWKLQYGPAGFAIGSGTTIDAASNTTILTGLSATQVYDVYVKSACSATDTSNWSGPVTIAIGGTQPGNSVFKVDVDGVTFNATIFNALVTSTNIVIAGSKSNGETVGIFIDGSGTGTYSGGDNIISYSQNAAAEYDYINMNTDFEVNGSVTITEINSTTHTISGTFNYIGYYSDFTLDTPPPSKAFTNGSFTIPYTENNNTGDTFYAKVNGVEFVDELITAAYASSGSQDVIVVNGKDANGDTINVQIDDTLGPGTYNFPPGVICTYTKDDVDYTANAMIPATVTILEKTPTHIKATFVFVVTGPTDIPIYTISEGAFDVDY